MSSSNIDHGLEGLEKMNLYARRYQVNCSTILSQREKDLISTIKIYVMLYHSMTLIGLFQTKKMARVVIDFSTTLWTNKIALNLFW